MKFKQKTPMEIVFTSINWCDENNIDVKPETGLLDLEGNAVRWSERECFIGRNIGPIIGTTVPLDSTLPTMEKVAEVNRTLTTKELCDPPAILVFENMHDKVLYQKAISSIIDRAINEDSEFDEVYQNVLVSYYEKRGHHPKSKMQDNGVFYDLCDTDKLLLRDLMHKKWNLVQLFEDRSR